MLMRKQREPLFQLAHFTDEETKVQRQTPRRMAQKWRTRTTATFSDV